jgi:hypothetical protein
MLDLKVDITESGAKKLNSYTYKKALSNILDVLIKETYTVMEEKGVGVAGGTTPSGGAPKGKVKGGNLRQSLMIDKSAELDKKITSDAPYWGYVVYGTSKMPPNDFPKRATDKVVKKSVIDELVKKELSSQGVL